MSLGSLWGCDVCQEVCPFSQEVEETPIAFFKEALVPYLTKGMLDAMDDEEFELRAYAWRTRRTIERNLAILDMKTE